MATMSIQAYMDSAKLKRIKMSPISDPATGEGTIFYDANKKCYSTLSDIHNVTFNIPLEQCTRAINTTGSTLLNGHAVRASTPDVTTGLPTIAYSIAADYSNARVNAILTHDVVDGEECWITTGGDVGDVDMTIVAESGQTLTTGTPMYLSAIDARRMTPTPPNIVSKLGMFMAGISGSVLGTFAVDINANMALPTVLATLDGQNVGTYNLTGTPQSFVDYAAKGELGMSANSVNGQITISASGWYSVDFVAAASFAPENSTRTMLVRFQPSVSPAFTVPIPMPRDNGDSALPLHLKRALVAGETVEMQISADDNFELTVADCNFSVTAMHLVA